MTELETRAMEFATRAHVGQKRKYTGEDYITHPAAVVEIVRSVPHTVEMIAAAWLHDVIEDCGVSYAEIELLFGSVVAKMVGDLTDVSKPSDGNRKVRKNIDLQHTEAALPDSKTIKLCDLLHNSESIMKHDPDFAKVYLQEKKLLLEILKEGDATLWDRAAAMVR